MIDLIDETAPLARAAQLKLFALVSHRLLPHVLFFLACSLVLLNVSMTLARSVKDGVPSSSLFNASSRTTDVSIDGKALYAYTLPSLQVIAINSGDAIVKVRVLTPGVSDQPLGQEDGGQALYLDVINHVVDSLVISGSVWSVSHDASLPGVLNLASTSDSSNSALVTSLPIKTHAGTAASSWISSWGTSGASALVFAFRGVV